VHIAIDDTSRLGYVEVLSHETAVTHRGLPAARHRLVPLGTESLSRKF
jgi:hypothetical protein